MKKKKIIVMIFSIAVIVLILFITFLYVTIKTKSTSLNNYTPYNSYIGKTVSLRKKTVLFIDKMYMDNNKKYPYELLDSLHPLWLSAQERKNASPTDIEEITTFPSGTLLHIDEAIQYTNGVSGNSFPVVFGTIKYNNQIYRIGYPWGTMNISKRLDKLDKCWSFHQAPWQKNIETTFYALPEAKYW